jgi:hypothetical protein
MPFHKTSIIDHRHRIDHRQADDVVSFRPNTAMDIAVPPNRTSSRTMRLLFSERERERECPKTEHSRSLSF